MGTQSASEVVDTVDLIRLIFFFLACVITSSGIASILFRRDSAFHWIIVLAAIWVCVLTSFYIVSELDY